VATWGLVHAEKKVKRGAIVTLLRQTE